MAHTDVRLAAHKNVAVLVVQVGEQVESEDDRAIGAVLERHYSTMYAAVLYCGEYILNGGLWSEGVVVR